MIPLTLAVCLLLGLGSGVGADLASYKQMLRFPNIPPTRHDAYLCQAIKVPDGEAHYVAELKAVPRKGVVHLLLDTCSVPGPQPGTPDKPYIWSCPAYKEIPTPGYDEAPVCPPGEGLLFAWVKNQPEEMGLPPGVGFRVGGDSGIKYLILQVHYSSVSDFDQQSDEEVGFEVALVPESSGLITKSAAMLFIKTEGEIATGGAPQTLDAACLLTQPIVIHPFAIRVHTHGLGRLGSAWKVAQDKEWSLIGKRDPRLPQGYYAVQQANMSLSAGDVVATRCVMQNDRALPVHTGDASLEEMCIFHLMYYADGGETLDTKMCVSPGPPAYDWSADPLIGPPPVTVQSASTSLA